MRVMILVEDKYSVPPDQIPALLEGFAAWRECYRDRMESFEFFAGGGGGFGVVNMPDEAALHRMIVEYPLNPFIEITVRPVLEGDIALGQMQEVMRQMMSGAS